MHKNDKWKSFYWYFYLRTTMTAEHFTLIKIAIPFTERQLRGIDRHRSKLGISDVSEPKLFVPGCRELSDREGS